MKRRQQIQPAPSSGPASFPASGIIPLPKSHIHRTPSELQLADDMRRAEYDDVRMYARLVVGMQSQCQVSGYVHPLTSKSLEGVVKTKQANDEELERIKEGEKGEKKPEEHHHHNQVESTSVDDSRPWSMLTQPRKSNSDDSMSTHLSMKKVGEEEDDCVFSLEL